jgi:50S ribosomal protein L16 3-hydroxylase
MIPELNLTALAAPLSPEAFLASHWPDRPYCSPAASATRLDSLGLAHLNTVDNILDGWSGTVRVHQRDAEGRYKPRKATATEARQAYTAGASLSFDRLDVADASLRSGLDVVAAGLGVPKTLISCVAFAAPPHGGVPRHFDAKEVMVIQLAGRKRWTLAANTEVAYPLEDYSPHLGGGLSPESRSYMPWPIAPEPPRHSWDVVMEPGGVLFVPRGYWHQTCALEPSLSLSLVIATPSHLDMFLAVLRRRLIADPIWRSTVASHRDSNVWRQAAREQMQLLADAYLGSQDDVR